MQSLPSPSRALRSLAALTALALGVGAMASVRAEEAGFWTTTRRGANCQNRRVSPAYWQAASHFGIEFVRLLPDAWPSAGRDFLLGNADEFRALEEADVRSLLRALDDAQAARVKVVVTMLSLPGARWKQLNGDRDDGRLWRDVRYQDQAAAFWEALASRLRGHTAVAALNPLNEPHPERGFGYESPSDAGYAAWRESARGTPADLDAFNRRMVEAIRRSDPDVPILLDGAFYASPEGLALLTPVVDDRVLYAFHFYDPWEFTTYRINDGRYAWPDRMPGASPGSLRPFTREDLRSRMAPAKDWAKRHALPPHRIVAGEFGVDRRVKGAAGWLEAVVSLLEESGWSWAFYSFRSDGDWTGLDYELGSERVDPRIWDAEKKGVDPERYKQRRANPLWDILLRRLAPEGTGQ